MSTDYQSLTESAFRKILDTSNSVIYMDTCFASYQGSPHCNLLVGLNFLSGMKEALLQSGKKIVLMHSVTQELEKCKSKREKWAKTALKYINKNGDLFQQLHKTLSESEMENQEFRKCFADEALRCQFLSDLSNKLRPVLLTADAGCARAISSIHEDVQVFFIDRCNFSAPTVLTWTAFQEIQENDYINGMLPKQLDTYDIILTASALRSKNLPYFVQMLNRAIPEGSRANVKVHALSLINNSEAYPALQQIKDKILFVNDGDFANEADRLCALYRTRNIGRKIMLVSDSENTASALKNKFDTSAICHINGRTDKVHFARISALGRLVPAVYKNQEAPTPAPAASSIPTQLNGANVVEALMHAAKNGDDKAMGVIANMYEQGLYLPQSNEQAENWRKRMRAARTASSAAAAQPTDMLHNFTQLIKNKFNNLLESLILIK